MLYIKCSVREIEKTFPHNVEGKEEEKFNFNILCDFFHLKWKLLQKCYPVSEVYKTIHNFLFHKVEIRLQ